MFKRTKKGLSSLLALVLILGTVFMTALPNVYADEPEFASGDGTVALPYEIQTAEQLNHVRNHLDAYYKLTADIDLTAYLADGGAGYNGGDGWEPIGTEEFPFNGTFDGNGKTIKGLKINRPAADYQGLFGYAATGSVFKKVGLVDANVTSNNGVGSLVGNNSGTITDSYASGTVAGNYAVGGLAGYNYGTISNSYATSELTGNGLNVGGLVGENTATITDSYASGTVTGASDVGGLVGKNNGEIQSSYATGAVTSNQNAAGGLVSYNNGGEIYSSYATGTVKSIGDNVGGLMSVNASNGLITNSYATGTVEGRDHVGGLLGVNGGSVSFSYALGSVQARDDVGGLVGQNAASSYIEHSYATGAVTGQNNVGGLAGINDFIVKLSYAAGTVIGNDHVGGLVGNNTGTIENSYAKGAVAAKGANVGGLTGSNFGPIRVSYYDIETTGKSDVGNGEGKSSNEMKMSSTYTGWDFSSTWDIDGGINNGYPYLLGFPFFTVSYDKNGSSSNGTVPASQSYPPGTMVIVSNKGDLTMSGSTFIGWNTQADGHGTSYAANATMTMGTANVTLYAQWTANPTYKVTYNGNESKGGSVPSDNSTYLQGATVTVSENTGNLVKTGFTFIGWNTQADGKGTDYAANATFAMGTDNVTLYAQWAATYTVTYNGNESTDGSVPSDNNTYIEGAKVTILGNAGNLVKDGFTFAGWNTQADGQGTNYAGNASLTMGTANVTLYAKWTANPTYTVSYSGNGSTGGSVPTDNNAYEQGTTVTVQGNTGNLVNAGYTFAGWNTQADGKGTSYAPSATFAMGTVNVTLYAQWTTNPTYTVSYSGNGSTGGSVPIDSGSYAQGVTVSVYGNTGSLVKTGYTFAGWNTQADGKGTSYAANSTMTMGTANVTLYAKWTANRTYTITYNGNGNTGGSVPIDSGLYAQGVTVSVYGNTGSLVKTGYTFAGWNTQADGQGTNYAGNATMTMGTANVTLYAKWTATNGSGNTDNTESTTPSSPSDNKFTATDGKITLPAGKTGKVSLGDAVTIVIPANATNKELIITIEKVLDTQKLLTNKEALVSPIFEILKNFPDNFNQPVTLTFAFDPTSLKKNQTAAVFYYDEAKKEWVKIVGGRINGDRITVEVNHFTKFAVFAVDTAGDVPAKDPSTETKPTITFSDVTGHWAEASIKQAVTNGIVSGYPDGTFKPDTVVTRAEFAVMLMNTLKPQGEGAALTFTDTAKIGTWAHKAVAQAVQAGIIKGYEDGSFHPDAVITRAEMAVMIARALSLTVESNTATGFTDDKDIPTWAKGAVAAIKKLGIIEGRDTNEFAPDAKTTRAEAVMVLLKTLAQKSK